MKLHEIYEEAAAEFATGEGCFCCWSLDHISGAFKSEARQLFLEYFDPHNGNNAFFSPARSERALDRDVASEWREFAMLLMAEITRPSRKKPAKRKAKKAKRGRK